VAKITVERGGKWILVWRRLSFRGRQAERIMSVMEQDQAFETLEALRRDGAKLTSKLGDLRKAVAG
jgi:hypothetical protein